MAEESKNVHFIDENKDGGGARIPPRLNTAKEGSFAYRTVKDRLPKILASVIDTLYKHKDHVNKEHGKVGMDDLKSVTGKFSKLRYEMMTNKPIEYLTDQLKDVVMWNDYMDDLRETEGSVSWFGSSWLFVECYMYRSIISTFKLSSCLKSYDPFANLKRAAFQQSLPAIKSVLNYLAVQSSDPPENETTKQQLIGQFLELSLWGNRCDLSISAGADNSQTMNALSQLGKLDDLILVNDILPLWEHLLTLAKKVTAGDKCQIDLVLDNAGFELVSDICLAEVLILFGFATRIVFHVKSYPWFVSDSTREDVQYTIEQLQASSLPLERAHAARWISRGGDKSFVTEENVFWTTCYDFSQMQKSSTKLYNRLSQSDLLIFKGDLNYRKLLGDREWPFNTSISQALNGFRPTSVLALRTIKSNVLCNANLKVCGKLDASEKDWLETGKYGVIQFLKSSSS